MRKYFLASLLIVSVLTLSLVVAFWPFSSGGVTGNVVDNTPIADGTRCIDSDGGVFATNAGYVLKIGTLKNTVYSDACSGTPISFYTASEKRVTGYSKITENYCDGNIRKSEVFNSTDLGAGYCIAATVTDDGTQIKSAKWAQLPQVCIDLGSGSVKNQAGTTFAKGCYGTDSKTFKSYSCSVDKTTVVPTEHVCNVRCEATKGCAGVCTAAADGKSVAFDGQAYNNTCLSTKAVRKYSCQEGGYLGVVTENCGTGRECITENSKGYCRDVIAGTATISSLQQQIADLITQIAGLTSRIEALETA